MHSYLRAIGFSNMKKGKEIEALLKDVFHNFDEKSTVKEDSDQVFMEYSKSFGPNMGIALCGNLDDGGFHQEYYFPYLKGSGISTQEDLVIEKHGGKDSFAGVCEDLRVGVSLIFYLQNAAKYKRESMLNRLLDNEISTTFSGLSLKGKVLLPLCKDEEQVQYDKEAAMNRNRLLSEARKGNEEAIESLTLEDIDIYTSISRRIQKEDVFSIVESYFMPYGMECDQYHVLGEIKSVEKVANMITGEKIYQIQMVCNDITFDICINQKDLVGEPQEGRRFKGVIWLQGHINFPKR